MLAGSCEHRNKPLCSIKGRKFLDYLSMTMTLMLILFLGAYTKQKAAVLLTFQWLCEWLCWCSEAAFLQPSCCQTVSGGPSSSSVMPLLSDLNGRARGLSDANFCVLLSCNLSHWCGWPWIHMDYCILHELPRPRLSLTGLRTLGVLGSGRCIVFVVHSVPFVSLSV
jgi:hypothetical protein